MCAARILVSHNAERDVTNKLMSCNFESRLTNAAGELRCWCPCSHSRTHTPTSASSTCSAAHPRVPPPLFFSNTLTYKVYDGENTSSRLLGNFTRDGMMGHVINSTSNRLWVEFNSNASGTNQGFRLTYTSELSSDGQLRVISAGVLFFFFPLLWPMFHLFKCSQKMQKYSTLSLPLLSTTATKKKGNGVAHCESPCDEVFSMVNRSTREWA